MKPHLLFAAPAWLWSLPALLALVLALWLISGWVSRRRAARFISEKIALAFAAPARRRRLVEFALSLAVLLLLALALARPLTGPRPGTVERSGVDLAIVLDISKSMLVEDVVPSRLGAVKKELREWLKNSARDRIALVPFAGDAFVMAPLTFDYRALDFILQEVGPRSITAGGTDLQTGIETAAELLSKEKANARAILLVSDGENLEGDALEAARKAHAEDRIAIFTVGVGTVAGGKVPADDYSKYEDRPPEKRPPKTFVRNEYGTWVTSHSDERSLRAIATEGGGRYFPFVPNAGTFQNFQNQSLRTLSRQNRTEHLDVSDYLEWYQIPLGCAILILGASPLLRLVGRKANAQQPGVSVVQPESFAPLSTATR